jgi:hypothetical protein
LRFSQSGDPGIEKAYRTHYVSLALSEAKQQRLQERLDKPKEAVAFQILRDSKCSECGIDLEHGSFLFMEGEQGLCLACAGLGEHEFLPAGDAALTRRATRYSERAVVVVRFSRSRGHYERQGILVESAALDRAEQECVEDADARAAARKRAAVQRGQQDRELVKRMAEEIRRLFPGCPPEEAQRIAEHTAVRGSGRVGRSAAGRRLDEQALTLAVAAAVRHRRTNYDELLASGMEREPARRRVANQVASTLDSWKNPLSQHYLG